MESNFDFRKRLQIVHHPNLRKANVVLEQDELLIESGWKILVSQQASPLIMNVAKDLQDYLFTSMNVSVLLENAADLAVVAKQEANVIVLATEKELPGYGENLSVPRSYRCICSPGRIIICGKDERGVGQGSYYLEDLMSLKGAPALKEMNVVRKPIFSPRMVHTGWGGLDFPDSVLNSIAHSGMDAIVLSVSRVEQAASLRQQVERAAKFGLDVYLISQFKSEKHPDDPDAERYYDGTYGAFFAACPGVKGVVLVGEACEFPSKDPNTTQRLRLEIAPDGIPDIRPSPGWWPCYDYPQWLELIKKTVLKYSPETEIVFWTYNWGWAPEEPRLELIRNLPEDISLLVTFEMFEQLKRDGVINYVADYTISFVGPGKYFTSEAKEAKKRNIRLYAMSNTAGMTWDFGAVPYIPVPFQWLKRHEALKQANVEWDLSGLMESHTYGLWPSVVSELAKWNFWDPSPDPQEILKRMAERDFGKGAPFALEAWRLWSEAINHYIPTEEDQYGPFRVGPSYPLLFWKEPFKPEIFFPDSHKGRGIIFLDYYFHEHILQTPGAIRLPVEIKALQEFVALWTKGVECLEKALVDLPAAQREKGERMLGIGKFILNSTKTAINVKRWWHLKRKLQVEEDVGEAEKILDEMLAIAKKEIENATDTLPLVEDDSRLGWEPSMGYKTDPRSIRWKIKQVQRVIEMEIPKYRKLLQMTAESK